MRVFNLRPAGRNDTARVQPRLHNRIGSAKANLSDQAANLPTAWGTTIVSLCGCIAVRSNTIPVLRFPNRHCISFSPRMGEVLQELVANTTARA